MPDVINETAGTGATPELGGAAIDVQSRQHQGLPAWPDRRLINLFQIEHPILLAPMAGLGTVELAAAVCRAGGLGSLGCGAMTPEVAKQALNKLRTLTPKPVNMNFFCHRQAPADPKRDDGWRNRLAPYYHEFGLDPSILPLRMDLPPFNAAMCAIVEDMRPRVVSFHFGLPESSLLARVKAAGCYVMSSATTVHEARWLEEHGADTIIAQGSEAGGHRGTFLASDGGVAVPQPGVLALVQQVVEAVSVPVVAAGGIADAGGITAALALGAAGVQIGTAYLLCPEAATSPLYRDALRNARETVLTNVFTGRPARAMSNRLTREVGPISSVTPEFPMAMPALAPLRDKAEQQGSTDFTALWAGEAAALAREMPGETLTRDLANKALQHFQQMDA